MGYTRALFSCALQAQYVFVHKAMVEYVDTHYTGKSPTRFATFPSLYTNRKLNTYTNRELNNYT